MNPGTILFIVLGLIGLLIYISKAIQPNIKENFSVIDESQISNKGKEGLQSLKDGTLNFETLLGAFSTPDVNLDRNLNQGPSISDFAKFKKPAEPKFVLPLEKDIPDSPTPLFEAPVKQKELPHALPVLTPSSIINMQPVSTPMPNPVSAPFPNPVLAPMIVPVPAPAPAPALVPTPMPLLSPSITMSDIQGSILPKSTEAFKEQGKYKKRRKRKTVYVPAQCPPMPDMSQYIRKDSIPCWGCNLK